MNKLIIKAKNFRQSIRQNGMKTEVRRLKNYIKYRKTVLNAYEEWQLLNEPNKEEIEEQKKYEPLLDTKFTIITSKDNENIDISNQTYENYSIQFFDADKYLENIKKLRSDYCIFIAKGIEMLPFALYDIERFIEYNECNLIYADNDYLIDGKRENPNFKPHFAYDNILSKNYFGNFIIIKTKFLQENENILENLSKTEPIYNIILNTITKTNRIMHIDKILYSVKEEKIDEEEQIDIIKRYLEKNNIKETLLYLLTSYKRIRANIDISDIMFKFLPDSFTLEDVRKVYELIKDTSVDKSNFRKKIVKYCEKIETEQDTKNGYRPSQRYCFKALKGDIWL